MKDNKEKPVYHEKAQFIRPGYDGKYRTGGFSRPEEIYYESELLEVNPQDFVRYCLRVGQYKPQYSTPSIRVRAGVIKANYGTMIGYKEPRHSDEDLYNIEALTRVAEM